MPLDFFTPEFEDGGEIPTRFTCDGENVNPTLQIVDVPDDVESLVIVVEDVDAERGDFVHWMVWNIPPTTEFIMEGEIPEEAVEGFNDFGDPEYNGPCPPPHQEHRYQFKLYALDTELDLEDDTSRGGLEKAMAGHILDEVMFVGIYGRK